jgi:DNA-binding CsgD family transcriptional regulator
VNRYRQAVLLERDDEMRSLRGIVAALGSSGGKVVVVRGEAGIGKSALVRELARSSEGTAHVAMGACDDLIIPQPLGPFWDIARVEPSLREPLGEGDRPRVLEATLALLHRPERPSLLIIEDTQWADEASLDAFRFLGRRIAGTNGALILTYRDEELDEDHAMRGVIGDIPAPDVLRVQLGGLSLAAVTTMMEGAGLDPRHVLAVTRGNPFLVTEMAMAAETGATSSLEDSVRARVQKLNRGSRELLSTLAVIPEPIPEADALALTGADAAHLAECEQRGLLERRAGMVAFRHELIRRAVGASLTSAERLERHRIVLAGLSEEVHTSLLLHCAVQAGDIERLLRLAPRSARYAAATGSHLQAARDFRTLGPHLDRLAPELLGPLLEEWAHEEFLVDATPEAIRLSERARDHYRARHDRSAESRVLARAAQYHESAGQRDVAEDLARQAVDVLGQDAEGADLARALEVSAYLQMMAGNVRAVPALIDRTLEAGGADIEELVLIRSLSHRGIVEDIRDYPEGRLSLDEAGGRAAAAGLWFEEARALLNHAWAAAEAQDLAIASDYARRAIASAHEHELPNLESYAKAIHARVLDLRGAWVEATDLAREVLDSTSAMTRMVALPIIGTIDARRGRPTALQALESAWRLATATHEFQRLAPVAIGLAERQWITGERVITTTELAGIMASGLDMGFRWSTGRIAAWLWRLGELSDPPAGIADAYRLLIEGEPARAAAIWQSRGMPYEQALALMHGSDAEPLEALELLEALGATSVAARLRRMLRERGIRAPRGKSRETRRHAAGFTARQAEVLDLLAEQLTNTEIADRLFISPRTVENHVAAVLDKLDAVNREEAVAQARTLGLISG